MPPRTERIRRSRSSLRLRAHTAGGVGLGGAHAAAEPYRITGEPCGERTSILPVELGCGNEQLGPPTVFRLYVVYIPAHCSRWRHMGHACTARTSGNTPAPRSSQHARGDREHPSRLDGVIHEQHGIACFLEGVGIVESLRATELGRHSHSRRKWRLDLRKRVDREGCGRAFHARHSRSTHGRWTDCESDVTLGELAECQCHRVAWGHGQPGAPHRSRRHPR
jgi:hypothetical protein